MLFEANEMSQSAQGAVTNIEALLRNRNNGATSVDLGTGIKNILDTFDVTGSDLQQISSELQKNGLLPNFGLSSETASASDGAPGDNCNVTRKETPHGVFVVLPVDDAKLDKEAAWNDPNVVGVLLRTSWSATEPHEGQFDWSYLDHGLALCRQHHKLAQISVNAGGGKSDDTGQPLCPEWTYKDGEKDVLKWRDSKGGTQPLPFDPLTEERYNKLVGELGKRYDKTPELSSVTAWCGGDAIECYFATTEALAKKLDDLGGLNKWMDAAQGYVDAYAKAFPSTKLYLATGLNYPDKNASMTSLAEYAIDRGFSLQSNALSGGYPNSMEFPHTQLSIAALHEIGYQTLAPMADTSRMKDLIPGTDIISAAIPFKVAKNHDALWLEVYPGDSTAAADAEQQFKKFDRETWLKLIEAGR
jgi:hypothetical protein